MPATPAPQLAPISLYALVGVLWRAGWFGTLYGGSVGAIAGFMYALFSEGSIEIVLFGAFWGSFIGGVGGFIAGVLATSLNNLCGFIAAGFLGGAAMFPLFFPAINWWVVGSMVLGGLAGALVGAFVEKEMERNAPRFFFLAALKLAIALSGLRRLLLWKRTGLATLFLCLTLVPLSAVLHGTAG